MNQMETLLDEYASMVAQYNQNPYKYTVDELNNKKSKILKLHKDLQAKLDNSDKMLMEIRVKLLKIIEEMS